MFPRVSTNDAKDSVLVLVTLFTFLTAFEASSFPVPIYIILLTTHEINLHITQDKYYTNCNGYYK